MLPETPSVETRAPRIVFPEKILEAITLLCGKNALEWTLFGKTRQEGQDFIVKELHVPTQTNTTGNTTVPEDGWDFLEAKVNAGEDISGWNLWIHSHNSMGCFWSGTDHAQMDSFGTDGPNFMLSVVVSSKGKGKYCDTLGAISFYKPCNARISGIDVVVVGDARDEALYTVLQTALEEKEVKPVWSGFKGGKKYLDDWNERKEKLADKTGFNESDNYGDWSGYHEGWKQSKWPMGKASKDPLAAREEEGLITKEEAEVALDSLFLEFFALSGMENENANIEIIEMVKAHPKNYYTIVFYDKHFIKLCGKKYKSTNPNKEFKKRLSPHIDSNSKGIMGLIRTYNGILVEGKPAQITQ